jgi:biopolymer transport protein ExbD
MKPMTPLQRRNERRSRNQSMVDMNLVSLIDVFTILIFFLLSNTGGVETLASPRAIKLPESMSEKAPKETLLVVVTGTEILVGPRVVSSVADAVKVDSDIIEPLKAALDVEMSREVIRKENEADSKHVTIMGDKDIPYRLLRKVMVSAARAGYTDVSFAVRQRLEP